MRKIKSAFSMVELLSSILIIGSVTTTYINVSKDSVEVAKSFTPVVIEKLALDTLNETTHELIAYNRIEERSFTKQGYNVLVTEGKCGGVVSLPLNRTSLNGTIHL